MYRVQLRVGVIAASGCHRGGAPNQGDCLGMTVSKGATAPRLPVALEALKHRNPGGASSVPETDSAGEAGLSLCCVLNAVDPGSTLVMMNRKQAEPRPPTTMGRLSVQTRAAHIFYF